MRKTILLPALLLLLVTTQAQRVDLDRFNFTVSYREFPEEPLPADYKTFNLRIEATPSLGYLSLGEGFEIEGLKRVQGTGHITILAILDDIVIEKSEMKERIDIKKDKYGNETRRIYYSNEMTYSFSARASVYDYKGNSILSNYVLFDRDKKQTYKTSEYSSPAEATNAFNGKMFETKNNLAKQLSVSAISNLNAVVNERYGFQLRRVNDMLWILNNRKHSSYADHQAAWNQFKNAIVLMSADESLEKVKEKMKPVIDYFEKAKNQYIGSDKEARKMRYASFYNLAKIYLWLDEPAKAKIEADALAMNDYDESDGKNLRAMAESLEQTLKKNNSNSRHFAVNSDSYQSPIK